MTKRKPITEEERRRGRELAEWRARYPEAWGFELEWDEQLGIPIPVQKRLEHITFCGKTQGNGAPCPIAAGLGTAHVGVGACFRHDSNVERVAGAWAVAHRIAQIVDISPWDALLLAVKRAAAWASFYDTKLAEVTNDDDLQPGGSAYEWVRASERVNDKLARWSKMAVDAGVAQLLVAQARTDGEQIVRVLNAALSAVGLTEEQEDAMRSALAEALRALGAEERGEIIEATVVRRDEDAETA